MAPLQTKNPFHMLAPGLWVADAVIQVPVVSLPIRAVAVQVAPGQLVLISPLHGRMCDYNSLKALGQVVAIVAPSKFHHLFVQHAQKEFPGAKLWAAPGLEQKRTDVKWDGILTVDPWPYQNVLELQLIEGAPQMNEVVLFHGPSQTLVVTDLLFNLQKASGFGARMIFGLLGTFRRLNTSRLVKWYTKDQKQVSNSLKRILGFNFDRLIMAHGEIIPSGAKSKVTPLLEKHLTPDAH
ncbi:MAG: DUF4336 domain-containing protein [Bdellovibrionales bacterium]